MYEFDMNNDAYSRRWDESYAHPEFRGVPLQGAYAPVLAILDNTKTLDEQLAMKKQMSDLLFGSMPPMPEDFLDSVTVEEIYIPGLLEDDPEIRTLIVKPKDFSKRRAPGLLYFFAGGMCMGTPDLMLGQVVPIIDRFGCVCVLPEYRTLPEYRYPCAVDDAEATVNYILAHEDELHIDPKRLVAMGSSAGAIMSACLSERLKMRGGYQLAGQLLESPVLDDTFAYRSSDVYFGDVWHPYGDQLIWEGLMGPNYNRSATPPDCVPGRAKSFKGLPPTVILTGSVDYAHDSVMDYASKLMNEGIFCHLHVWGGCFHGFRTYAMGTEFGNRVDEVVFGDLGDLFTGECSRG